MRVVATWLCALVLAPLAACCSGLEQGGAEGPAARGGGLAEPSRAGLVPRRSGPFGVLVAPAWSQDGALASGQQIYTEPGDVPRLRVQGDRGELLPLEHTDVRARLTGFVAEVEVRQTYGNPHREPIEAVYVFPLPENSAVNRMRMEIGDRVVEAEIRRRDEARREYEAARREGYTAALLEQERPNVFTQSVANIAPGESIVVAVRYVQDLTYDAGRYEFVFPMVVGPRFVPGQETGRRTGTGTYGDTDEVPDASRITPPYLGRGERSGHDISIDVVADGALAVGEVESLTHEVYVDRGRDGRVHLALAERESVPNRDFVLRYGVAGEEPNATLFLSNPEGPGYFSLAVHPPTLDVEELVGRREMIFVVDVSGSMSGVPLSLCRLAMREALRSLRPVDTFNVLTFSGGTTMAFERPRPANDANLRQAFRVVDEMTAGGGTHMADAVAHALSPEVEQGRRRYVFFMTDGYVGNEDGIIAASGSFVETLEARGQRAMVFGFGVGSSPNRMLLDGLSRAGRGIPVYATNREDPARAVNQFFRYVDHAVLEDVVVDFADLGATDVQPEAVPDLFASHALVLHGRYERPPTRPLAVHGASGGRRLALPVAVRPAAVEGEPTAVLGSLWARSRVESLEEGLRRGEGGEDEIVTLGLEHHLVTRLTSFVAVDRSRRVGQGVPRQIVQPVAAPEGVDMEMAGARGRSAARRSAFPPVASAPMPVATAEQAAPSEAPSGPGGGGGSVTSLLDGALGGSSGSVRHRPPTKTADAARPTSLAPAAVRTALRPLRGRLLACYESGLARTAGLAGQVVVRLEIAPDGRVSSAAVVSGSLADPAVRSCVATALAGARFPAEAGPGARVVTYPLVFAPDPARAGRGTLR